MENREIKFRGKRTYDGSWVYGYYFYDSIKDKHFILALSPMGDIREAKIKPETLGQYIGQKDVNGTEIYKGDILEMVMSVYGKKIIKDVAWSDRYTRFFTHQNGAGELVVMEENNCKIIDNIHDNQELLNKDK